MSLLRNTLTDLREKRLWPLALLLLAALIAIPVLVSSGGSGSTVAIVPNSAVTTPSAAPPVQVTTTPTPPRLSSKARNPFGQLTHAKSSTASASASAASKRTAASTSPSAATPSTAATHSTTGTASSSSSTTTTTPSAAATPTTTTPASSVPATKPKPAPAGLSATESYAVSMAITNTHGGFDTVPAMTRLSPVPSAANPDLVELGVLRGGRRVLFTVQPGTDVSGPATCIPGPVDCEILSVAPGQVEDVLGKSAVGAYESSQFTITRISVARHASVAVADRARDRISAAGRQLLDRSTLRALPLFHYDAGEGSILDLRNLIVGSN